MKNFRLDFVNLIDKFSEGDLLSIAMYESAWTDLEFYYIFAKLVTYTDLMSFLENVFDVIVDFFVNPTSPIATKVCCVYSLFTIYKQQPIRNFVPIRVTCADWKSLREFVTIETDAYSGTVHRNMIAMLKILYDERAFRFVLVRSFVAKPLSNAVASASDNDPVHDQFQTFDSNFFDDLRKIDETLTETNECLVKELTKLQISTSLSKQTKS